MILLFLNCLPNSLTKEEPDAKAQLMTLKCFLNGLCHRLKDTKTSASSGTSEFVDYIHSIPERHEHSSGIATVMVELNVTAIQVVESQI